MCHDGKVTTLQFRQSEDTAHRSEFLPAEAAHDTRFTEECLHRSITAGYRSCMTACRPAAALTATRLDGCDTATLAYQTGSMEKQLIRIGDTLYVKQFHAGVMFRVEVLIHILQYILDTYLFAVSHRPHAVKLEPLDYGTLQDKYGCSTGTADEVDTLRIEVRHRFGKHRMVVTCEQTDAVRSDECSLMPFTGVEYLLFQQCPLVRFLAESCRYDDKGAHLFFSCEQFHVFRAHLGRNHQDRSEERRVGKECRSRWSPYH